MAEIKLKGYRNLFKVQSIILFVFLGLTLFYGDDLRSNAAGDMQIALPTWNNRINLYQVVGNTGWLQMNDPRNWMQISGGSTNSWGELRRYWDAYGIHTNALTFAGQKHVSETQTFYGAITYNIDQRTGVNRAIELEPYALDPFVLCDSTQGDFNYNGPTVAVGFSHHILPQLWWGVGLNYAIYRGLKKNYSMPEIIRRNIQADFSWAYRINKRIALGISFRPYDLRDLTKIVQQPDGTEPVVYRYRGEFEFTSVTSKDDRVAIYNGAEIIPQIMLHFKNFRGIVFAGYYYRWHEVYDNVHLRKYEGYYQGRHYYFNTFWRWDFGQKLQNILSVRYQFRYIQDWAEEPLRKFAIYRSFHHIHDLTLGFSKRFRSFTLALEGNYRYYLPNKKDYLAHVYREAAIKSGRVNIGGIYRINPKLNVEAGMLWKRYSEPAIWHYFGDYDGMAGTLGASYKFKNNLLQIYTKFGKWQGKPSGRKRIIADFTIQLKQFLR